MTNDQEIYGNAIRVLSLTVGSALVFPEVKNKNTANKLWDESLSYMKEGKCSNSSVMNSIKSIMLLNCIVLRTVAREAFSMETLERDSRALNNAMSASSLKDADKVAIREISSFFRAWPENVGLLKIH